MSKLSKTLRPKKEFSWWLSNEERCYARELAEEHRKENRVEAAMNEFTRLDNEAREYHRTHKPPVKVENINNRTFVTLGDQEFIAEYCTDIYVSCLGAAPEAIFYEGPTVMESCSIYGARTAEITVALVSGRKINFTCNRHALEATLIALRKAHREALRRQEKPE